jgi:hypothetical protein
LRTAIFVVKRAEYAIGNLYLMFAKTADRLSAMSHD